MERRERLTTGGCKHRLTAEAATSHIQGVSHGDSTGRNMMKTTVGRDAHYPVSFGGILRLWAVLLVFQFGVTGNTGVLGRLGETQARKCGE